jgi:NADH:ubiquinone oxidoreductase subunit 6 (subunit J)
MHNEFLALAPVLVFAHAVNAVFGSAVGVVAKSEKRRHVAVGNEPYVASVAAVAAVGAAEGFWAFATETDAASSAVTAAHV